jgi:hypothetical protein
MLPALMELNAGFINLALCQNSRVLSLCGRGFALPN